MELRKTTELADGVSVSVTVTSPTDEDFPNKVYLTGIGVGDPQQILLSKQQAKALREILNSICFT